MPDGPAILLALKVLVAAVSLLFAAALVAVATGRRRLHGRVNIVFFTLTMTTVVGFELLLRLGADVSAGFSDEARRALRIHLCFAVPSALLMPLMLVTGLKRVRILHVGIGVFFAVLWAGTFVTGVFFLPHAR